MVGSRLFELDNVVVGYDIGNLRFDNQIEIEGADDGPSARVATAAQSSWMRN